MFSRRGGRTLLGEVLLVPFGLFVWVGGVAWMSVLAAITFPITLFKPFEKFQLIMPQPQMGYPIRLSFTRLGVEIDPRFDRTRPSALVQNHVSVMDGNIACGTIPQPICGLENASHLNVPGYGWVLRMANAIAVRKGKGRYEALAAAFKERASRGISILTFPEAHRTPDGNVQPFKRGVFRMARDAEVPIVPVCVRGAFRMLPKGSLVPRPSRVEVFIGPQIETKGLTDAQLDVLAERVRHVAQAWIDRREKLGDLCLEPIEVPAAELAAEGPDQLERLG